MGFYCVVFNVGRLQKRERVRGGDLPLSLSPAAVSYAVGTDLFFFFSCLVLEFPSCSRFRASACERVRRRASKTRKIVAQF